MVFNTTKTKYMFNVVSKHMNQNVINLLAQDYISDIIGTLKGRLTGTFWITDLIYVSPSDC